MSDIVKPGVRVIVPFGRGDKSREGYVLDILESTDFDELKEIKEVLDDQPIINSDMIKLAKLSPILNFLFAIILLPFILIE